MNPTVRPHHESNSTSTLLRQPGVLVVKRHHVLVRLSHWLNVPLLLGLVLSGISIYWSSPIYQHKPDPVTGNFDVAADIGIWICAHILGQHHYASPPDWLYNHMSLGPGMLAPALRIHWFCAYLFMLNGTVYAAGLLMGGGWRSLLPRRTDLVDALRMFRYYLGFHAKLTPPMAHRNSIQSTTLSSVQRTFLFRSPGFFRSPQAGRFINRCSSIGWLRYLEALTRRVYGISGLCGSSFSLLFRM